MTSCRRRVAAGVVLAIGMLTGCGGGPTAVEISALNAEKVGQKAVEAYDTDQDGLLSESELKTSPSLAGALVTLDTDGDKKLSAAEIAACVQSWRDMGIGLVSLYCTVTQNGRPLAGASVTLEPEAFLENSVQVASGVSDGVGEVRLATENGGGGSLPPGVQPGFYRVRISRQEGGQERIPEKYNAETTLGCVVPSVDRNSDSLQFDLK